MGFSYANARELKAHKAALRQSAKEEKNRIAAGRNELAMKITMAVVDRVVNEIIRPGPKPEERECYVMAGELRAITPELETLVRQIIDVNDGVE